MKLEGYIKEILKELNDLGHETYIVGKSVFLYYLKQPIEEYDIITSAPLFLIREGKIKNNQLLICSFSKPITIHFQMSLNSYYEGCSLFLECLFYHIKEGLGGLKEAFTCLEKRRIHLKKHDVNSLLLGLCYATQLSFSLDRRFEEDMKKKYPPIDLSLFSKYLICFLLSTSPSLLFLRYASFFESYFTCNKSLKIIDYVRNTPSLRILAFISTQANPSIWLNYFDLNEQIKMEIEKILPLLDYQETDDFLDFAVKQEISLSLWFPLKRAMALYEQNFSKLKRIDSQEKRYILLMQKNNLNQKKA